MPDIPKVAIVIVNWNGKDDTLKCLESLRQATYPTLSVIVVDNGSSDGSLDEIRASFPQVCLIDAGRNLGFSGGSNLGMLRALDAGVDAVLLLNNDTVVAPDFIEPLVEILFSDESIGAVNSKVYYYSEPNVIWSAGGGVDPRTGISYQRHIDEVDKGQADVLTDVDYAVGCAIMVRRDTIEAVGMLDEDFFLYYEEAEWCHRMRGLGYRIVYVPASRVWHNASRTAGAFPHKMLYYFCRNRLLYLRRGGAGAFRQARLIATDYTRMAGVFLIRRQIREAFTVMRAVADYCRGRFGQAAL